MGHIEISNGFSRALPCRLAGQMQVMAILLVVQGLESFKAAQRILESQKYRNYRKTTTKEYYNKHAMLRTQSVEYREIQPSHLVVHTHNLPDSFLPF
jgi:hypothetical protein